LGQTILGLLAEAKYTRSEILKEASTASGNAPNTAYGFAYFIPEVRACHAHGDRDYILGDINKIHKIIGREESRQIKTG